MLTPTAHVIRLLAAHAMMDARSVRRAYTAPSRVRNGTLVRLVQAAHALGVPAPVAQHELAAALRSRGSDRSEKTDAAEAFPAGGTSLEGNVDERARKACHGQNK